MKESINFPDMEYIDNEKFSTTSELYSFLMAIQFLKKDTYISFGDVLFKPYVLDLIDEIDDEIVIAVDTEWNDSVNKFRAADYVECNKAHSRDNYADPIFLKSAGEEIDNSKIHGEWMGIMKVKSTSISTIKESIESLSRQNNFEQMKIHQNNLVRKHGLKALDY